MAKSDREVWTDTREYQGKDRKATMAAKDVPPSRLFSKMTIKGKDGTSTRSKELNSEYPDLNEFELLDTLGTGTFGRVRLCRHTKWAMFLVLHMVRFSRLFSPSDKYCLCRSGGCWGGMVFILMVQVRR